MTKRAERYMDWIKTLRFSACVALPEPRNLMEFFVLNGRQTSDAGDNH
jgi:hypothetical protein